MSKLVKATSLVMAGLAVFLLFQVALVDPLEAEAAVLKAGSSGSQVTAVQQKLKTLGYYTYTVDGIFGSRTTTAVRNFQRDKGLTVDGIVGNKTAAALGISLSASSVGGYSSSEVYLLAKCIYAEARGEPYAGKVAVGAVVLNRVKSSKFPNTISGVIYQPYAFTAVADGQINLSPDQSCLKAAQDAINGWDPSYGCLYYFNPKTATSSWIWSRKQVTTIGNHIFCL